MSNIYAITLKEAEGPCGHGEPGTPYLALATDGEYYDLGDPLPVFTSEVAAEMARVEFDKYDFYEITRLEIHE